MLEMVFLKVSPVSWKSFVVQEVMGQVVADISENTTTKHGRCNSFIPVKEGMCKLVKRYREGEEQGWWHDQSELVHWEIMMDAVEKEVEGQSGSIIW